MCVEEKEASLVLHAKRDKKSLQVVLGFGPRNPHLAKTSGRVVARLRKAKKFK